MKLLFLVLICILLFLVFYKSNEGFNNIIQSLSGTGDQFSDDLYNFHNKYTLNEQEIQMTLKPYIEECVRDYNNELFKIGHIDHMCPPDKPRCLGRSLPGHWGECHPKNVLKCKDDYNEATYNNGNGTGRFMCPSTHPKCYNYSETDSRLGTCIRPRKEQFLKNCSGDYNSENTGQEGTCPEYIPKCVINPTSPTNAPNGICAHKDFHNNPNNYYPDHTNTYPNNYPICERSYITNNGNENQIYLSLQQRDYGNHSRDPENRHHFHGNSVCPITEPICVGRTGDEWGTCKSFGTPGTEYTHPPQELIKDDGEINFDIMSQIRSMESLESIRSMARI